MMLDVHENQYNGLAWESLGNRTEELETVYRLITLVKVIDQAEL